MKKIILTILTIGVFAQANTFNYEASVGVVTSNYNNAGVINNEGNSTKEGSGTAFSVGVYKEMSGNNDLGVEFTYSDVENTEMKDLSFLIRHNYSEKVSWNVGLLYSDLEIKTEDTCKEFGFKAGLDYKLNKEFLIGLDYKKVDFDITKTTKINTKRTEFNLTYLF